MRVLGFTSIIYLGFAVASAIADDQFKEWMKTVEEPVAVRAIGTDPFLNSLARRYFEDVGPPNAFSAAVGGKQVCLSLCRVGDTLPVRIAHRPTGFDFIRVTMTSTYGSRETTENRWRALSQIDAAIDEVGVDNIELTNDDRNFILNHFAQIAEQSSQLSDLEFNSIKALVERATLQEGDIQNVAFQTPNTDDHDTDDDLLSDREERRLNLDPENDDTDGDGLLDGWEVNGFPYFDENGRRKNLKLKGADPLRADIYVQMDYMVDQAASIDFKPSASIIKKVKQVFADAEFFNDFYGYGDGSKGISIHLEIGEEIPYQENLEPFIEEFRKIKRANFEKEKAQLYHYMIWVEKYDGTTSSGVSLGIPHSDFIVALGSSLDEDQKIGTFLHELGHNLNLKHGGCDHRKYKPNHLSVMNYSYQFDGVPGATGPVFDYQRMPTGLLNENNLDESYGLGVGAAGAGLRGAFYEFDPLGGADPWKRREFDADKPINWNADTENDDKTVRADLNRDGLYTFLCAPTNEWESIVFTGGAIGRGATLSDDLALEAILDDVDSSMQLPAELEFTLEDYEIIKD